MCAALFKKRAAGLSAISSDSPSHWSPPPPAILSVTDQRDRLSYIVDTGAAVSVLPYSSTLEIQPVTLSLVSAAGISIRTHGRTIRTVSLPGFKPHQWTFIVADVRAAYLGADFLRATGLLVDLAN